MNKLLGLFLLALAFFAPISADAASRFLICTTTCTLDAVDTSIWSASSGGGTGASVPGASDDVTLDANTCVGGTTCTATFGAGYNPTWTAFTMSACTASTTGCIVEANTNGNTITLTNSGNAYTNTGSGTRTLSGGTWVISGNAGIWNIASTGTLTNSPSVSFTGSGGTTRRAFTSAGVKTYGTVTVAASSSALSMGLASGSTIGTLTIAPSNRIYWGAGGTVNVTTITNTSGSSSTPTIHINDSPNNGVATISSANNWTCDWCGFGGMTFSGGGTFTANNSANYGSVTGITVNAPSVGGGGGGRIIGG